MSNGIENGILVDPQAYFASRVQGQPASNWKAVLNALAPDLERFGIGQQRDSAGNPRGRLYLPHAGCPNAAPRPGEERFGVRQEEICWELNGHAVDVVNREGTEWVWQDRGGPAYQPLTGVVVPDPPPLPPPVPLPDPNLAAQLAALSARLKKLEDWAEGQVFKR